MPSLRLSSVFWVKAHIRLCQSRGIPAFVVRRGADQGGGIYVIVNSLGDGLRVLAPFSGQSEQRAWYWGTGDAPVSEERAKAFLDRQLDFDDDIWILEIEDRDGRHLLDDQIVDLPD